MVTGDGTRFAGEGSVNAPCRDPNRRAIAVSPRSVYAVRYKDEDGPDLLPEDFVGTRATIVNAPTQP